MRLEFYNVHQYRSYGEAKRAEAVREHYVEDYHYTGPTSGAICDAWYSVIKGAMCLDGDAELAFFVFGGGNDDQLIDAWRSNGPA